MLSPQQVEAYQRDGYVDGGVVLSSDEVDELRAELDRVIAGEGERPLRIVNLSGDDGAPVWQIVNIWEASKAFERLLTLPAIVEAAAQLIGADRLRVWHDQIQYKPPRHGGFNHWHQDGPLWPVLDADSMTTAWIALDDVDESNGCMSMVPGSHRWGNHIQYLRSVEDYERIGEGFAPPAGESVAIVRRPVVKGAVAYHHCLTWHGSHGNTSNRPRRAIAIHLMADGTPFKSEANHLCKPYIEAGDGEPVRGDRFPIVYDRRQPALA